MTRAIIRAEKLAALAKNAEAVPSAVMRQPPRAGPRSRVAWKTERSSAMADRIWSLATNSGTSAAAAHVTNATRDKGRVLDYIRRAGGATVPKKVG